MDPARYPIPSARHRVEQEIQRSRFITTLAPAPTVEAAKAFIEEIREEFPDATHNCWAYLVGPPGSTGQVGMSDDGEPHGTAGRPMLQVLLHSGLGDVAAVVTRYFGGTKLGTGGLVRAYSGSVQQALESAPRAERVERVRLRVRFDYPFIDPVRRLLPEWEAEVEEEEYGAGVAYVVRLPEGAAAPLTAALRELTSGRVEVERVE